MKRRVYQLTLAVLVALGIILGVVMFTRGEMGRGLMGLGAIAFLAVPPLFKRLVGAHPYLLYIQLFAFCILAYNIGFVYQQFDTVPLLDKTSHFLSGFVFTTLGCCVYLWLRRGYASPIGRPKGLCVAFGVFFSSFVAVFWEICEFTRYVLTGYDSQHHLTTGVFDTMYDLICCTVGSLICAASILLYLYRGWRLPSGAVVHNFLKALQQKGIKPTP